jgi:hypothetical protein
MPIGASTAIFTTPSTPGQFGQFLYVYGKNYWNWDISATKRVNITERVKLTIFGGATNFLNHPEWGVTTPLNIQSTTFGQVASPMNGSRSIQFRGVLSF